MITNEARSDVYVNGQQAGQELEKLATKAEKLKKEMVELRKANDKAGFDKKQKELRSVNTEMKNLQKQAFDANKVLKNLKSSSLEDLYKAQRKLNREMKKLPANSKEFKQMESDAKKLAKQIDKVRGNTKGLKSPLTAVKGLLAGIGVVAVFKELITNIISVRSEFQKYEAVLTNALGSQQAANLEMKNLQQFAANTPFQLNELTDAYVKLVNQGFKPSMKEMTKLGDIAATQGKSFDQLAEAIIDAQTGEFERLKEFGIRASKQGDQVSFTFRGIEQQVAFTANSIQDYILGLGDMEGVTGSMSAISETLGGRISNLKDSWTNMMNSMGENSTGIMVNIVNWMIDVVNTIDAATKKMRMFKMEYLEKNVADKAAISIQQIESLIREGLKAGETYSEARLHAMRLFTSVEQDYIDDRMKKAREAREQSEVELAEKYEYEALMAKKGIDVIKQHYIEEEKLRKKKAEDYQAELIKQQQHKDKELEKENIKKAKSAKESLDVLYDQEMAALHQQYLDKEFTTEEYENEIVALKVANLLAEIEIRKQFNLDYADLEEELFSIRVDYMDKMQQEQEKRTEKEKADAEKKAKEDQREADKEFKIAQKELQKKYDSATGFVSDLTGAVTDALAERKAIEAQYNSDVNDLEEELHAGRIERDEYEERLAELSKDRREADIEANKSISQNMLLTVIDYLRKFAHAKIAEITIGSLASAESIATFGAAGVAKAAVLTALVEGALGLATAKISQNYAGRYPVVGADDNQTYMASYSGPANTGMYTSPTLVAERGTEMIIDNPTLSNITINRPDIIRDIMSMKVPQRAFGAYPLALENNDGELEMLELIAKEVSQLRNDLLSGNIKSVVEDYQLREMRNRINTITEIENSVSK